MSPIPNPEHSASESHDSALQYVSIDLLEADVGPDDQREILEPVEAEMRTHWDRVLREGAERAITQGPSGGARWVTEELASRISYDDVPEAHRDEIEAAVEKRLEEKQPQLAEVFDDLIHDLKQRATVVPEDLLVNWGAVV